MGRSTDESKTGMLPEPELNPLVNPLLAAHMGRWAEVYFTSPPEKRAQAVSDLVRELANNSTPPASSQPRGDEHNHAPAEPEVYEDSSSGSGDGQERPVIFCESCGHKNSSQQKFCGMCGALLAIPLEPSSQPFAETQPTTAADWNESESSLSEAPEQHYESPLPTAPGAAVHEEAQHSSWPAAEDNSARFSVLSDYETEPARHPYRIYVGLGVVILLGLLVYATWRSNAGQRGQPELPDAPPAVKSEAPAATASHAAVEPAAPAKAQPSPKAGPTPRTAPAASATPSRNGARQEESPSSNQRSLTAAVKPRAASRTTSRATTATVSPTASAAGQSGSEELAAAERYLNTGAGTARDSREAATWLWKAVAKQNLTATLLLSDLYLRGDGVSKSCDQARLLLDAAARKGATTAAERLRHLPAFGCR